MKLYKCLLISSILLASSSAAAPAYGQLPYYWKAIPVGDAAEVLTLFWRTSSIGTAANQDVPLVAVLRDTLGDSDPANDRLSYLWLLTYSHASVGQRMLSAVPFFYWRVGRESRSVSVHTGPLLDLSAPTQPVISRLARDILQWAVLDQMTPPARAFSHAYRANELDYERLHLEEAISYLRNAPVSDNFSTLTQEQTDTIIGRLELRKHRLGGLINLTRAALLGEKSRFEEERIRSQNWEILRQCAEKTGLIFEPLDLAGTTGRYGALWFPLKESSEPVGPTINSVWKLLNIKNVWRDRRLRNWQGTTYNRALDGNGSLLPVGASGGRQIALVLLGIYSLSYPRHPLLLIDFRDKQQVRRHEIVQRAITEITSGVLGISHFTNWYYYLGIELFQFVAARHGSPVDQSARLDSYAQFRAGLALDQELDPVLRRDMQSRVESLTVNPLIGTPHQEMQIAGARYTALKSEAKENGRLMELLLDNRRVEIASFGETTKRGVVESLLNSGSFGFYKRRTKRADAGNMAKLDSQRRIRYQLTLLDSVVEAGTPPEVSHESSRLRASIVELSDRMTSVQSSGLRAHVAATLKRLGDLSKDAELQADCLLAITSLQYKADRATVSGITSPTRTAVDLARSKGPGPAFHSKMETRP
jgi:hypothetical protein